MRKVRAAAWMSGWVRVRVRMRMRLMMSGRHKSQKIGLIMRRGYCEPGERMWAEKVASEGLKSRAKTRTLLANHR